MLAFFFYICVQRLDDLAASSALLLSLDAVTMTTGRCFHLPGSLCDCANATGLWKGVEDGDADGCQAHYVTQVTAIDGRLLSSVLKPVSVQR